LLQKFVVATGVPLETTDQEKANWIEAYVDLIDPQIFENLSRGRGSKPHPPARMFKLAIYQILKRHLSPAKWAREVLSDTILQKLIGFITPSRSSLYSFCDRIGRIIDRINQSLLLQSIQFAILTPSIGVLDGTSIRSYGSRHRIVNQK
jgi:transposase